MRSKNAHTRRRDRQRRLRKIEQLSSDRQQAWLETGKPVTTSRLTHELGDNYAQLREDRATDRAPKTWEELRGDTERTGLEWLPFRGKGQKATDA